jgi:hypothetical protein
VRRNESRKWIDLAEMGFSMLNPYAEKARKTPKTQNAENTENVSPIRSCSGKQFVLEKEGKQLAGSWRAELGLATAS